MIFEYIDENLNRIIQNPSSVLYLRPFSIGKKEALFAIVKEENGVYKKVQITKEISKLIFPIEPIFHFYNGPGRCFLNNFMTFNNYIALNISYLDGFKTMQLDNYIYNIGIFATFNDGSATFVKREKIKSFEKQGELTPYINQLKQFKDYEPQYKNYNIIESHKVDDETFVIPELQNQEKRELKKSII